MSSRNRRQCYIFLKQTSFMTSRMAIESKYSCTEAIYIDRMNFYASNNRQIAKNEIKRKYGGRIKCILTQA